MRLMFFLFSGVAGLALSFYSVQKMLILQRPSETLDGVVILFRLAAVLMLLAGLANLYAAWALSFGRVVAVLGSVASPVLIDAKGVHRSVPRIKLKRNLDEDQRGVPEEKQVILFLCGWRPWSCSVSKFLKDGEHLESGSQVLP